MTPTARVIDRLASQARPVRPLRSPGLRLWAWLAIAATTTIILVAGIGLVPRAPATPLLAIEWLAASVTGVLAAYATFQVSVPGRSGRWAWLPVPALLSWLVILGVGASSEVAAAGGGVFVADGCGAMCLALILMLGAAMGLPLLVMVRHAGAVRPVLAASLGTLAAAALAAAATSLLHGGGGAATVLAWHLGAASISVIAGALSGRFVFDLIGRRRAWHPVP